jgi:hypothetical protein
MHNRIVRARPFAIRYKTVANKRSSDVPFGIATGAAFDGAVAMRAPTFRRRNPD